jgi:Mn2+/Fe2+ NRAMP family transporter
MKSSAKQSAILGAAFLMATSAIGPGFLTQTTVFTSQLLTSFGFVILISILLDIGAQLNIWIWRINYYQALVIFLLH